MFRKPPRRGCTGWGGSSQARAVRLRAVWRPAQALSRFVMRSRTLLVASVAFSASAVAHTRPSHGSGPRTAARRASGPKWPTWPGQERDAAPLRHRRLNAVRRPIDARCQPTRGCPIRSLAFAMACDVSLCPPTSALCRLSCRALRAVSSMTLPPGATYGVASAGQADGLQEPHVRTCRASEVSVAVAARQGAGRSLGGDQPSALEGPERRVVRR
jgi:hypothetical protein